MARKINILLGSVFFIFIQFSTFAQTCCTSGSPLTGVVNIRTLTSNSWGIGLTYNNNVLKDLIQDSKSIDEDYISRHTGSIIGQIDYGISEHLTGTILLPYVTIKENINSLSGISQQSAYGIADILLMSQYSGSLKNNARILIGGGIKLPTGATKFIDNESGIILPANMQPGTGSIDFLSTFQFQTSFNFRKSLIFAQTFSFRFNTPSSNFTFHNSYRFGHILQLFTTISDEFVIGKILQNPFMTIHYRHSGQDIAEGYISDNTGGHWIHVGPGYSIHLNPKVRLGLSGEIPVYRKLNGFQLTTSYRWVVTLQFLIPKPDNLTFK